MNLTISMRRLNYIFYRLVVECLGHVAEGVQVLDSVGGLR